MISRRGVRCVVAGIWAVQVAGVTDAAQPVAPADAAAGEAELNALHRAGQVLFEHFAPAEVRAQFDFPTMERWDGFVTKFRRALEGDSLADLAACAADGRSALSALRMVPGYDDLADWLEQRIDEFEGAEQALRPKPAPVPTPTPKPRTPGQPPVPTPAAFQPVPHYNLWMARVSGRQLPKNASTLIPRLRAAFTAEGVPAELIWLAEAESSLNPAARSPVGAKGLFQFMPETAKSMGLSTSFPDERTDPEKSARAAARYLKSLHAKFGNWALVLAAYNAGEGRVRRTMTKTGATSFTSIADALPAETRMYVPKVCALIATRAGVPPERIGKK